MESSEPSTLLAPLLLLALSISVLRLVWTFLSDEESGVTFKTECTEADSITIRALKQVPQSNF